MAEEFQQPIAQDPVSALLSEFGTRLNEIEEKQRLIKDRLLLVGENLISTKEDLEKQTLEFREQSKQINSELKIIKQLSSRIINELESFARKPELEILERQMKMFNPLKSITKEGVKKIIREHQQTIKKKKS